MGVVVEDDRLVLRLEGRLSVAQVPELLKTWANVEPAELDLAELVSADTGGIEALRRIRDAGTVLVGAPGYIRLRIESSEESTGDRPQPRNRDAG
jgi:ABC-type transporter Mla MlaB component